QITPETLAWLGKQLADAPRSRPPRDDIRVLLLHHHPCDLNPFRRRSFKEWAIDLALMERLTRLEEGERLLDQCRGRVDIILHGHEHFPCVFYDKRSECLVVSAGTTSEYHPNDECGGNSFHALAFDDAAVRICQFDWSGSRFRKRREWLYDL